MIEPKTLEQFKAGLKAALKARTDAAAASAAGWIAVIKDEHALEALKAQEKTDDEP